MRVLWGLCLTLVVVVSTLNVGVKDARADQVEQNSNFSKVELMTVNKAVVVINHRKGVETMLFSVEIPEPKDTDALWVIPVLAGPGKITVSPISHVPVFEGEDLFKGLRTGYKAVFGSMRTTAWAPIGLFMLRAGLLDQAKPKTKVINPIHDKPCEERPQDLSKTPAQTAFVYSTIGPLPEGLRPVFDEQVKQGYSFVITRITDLERFKKSTAQGNGSVYKLNVRIDFPTSKIFVPASVQGTSTVPVNVFINGHVSVERLSLPKNSQAVYLADAHPVGQTGDFGMGIDTFQITRIDLDPAPKGKSADLWIAPQTPARLAVLQVLHDRIDAVWLVILLVFSGIASVCAARLAYAKNGPRLWPFFVLGVWNYVSFLGLCAAAKFRRISQKLLKDPYPSEKTMDWKTAIGLSITLGALLLIGQWFLIGHSLTYVMDMLRYHGADSGSSLAAFTLLASVPVIFLANDRPARVYLALFLLIFVGLTCAGEWLAGAMIR